MCNSGEKVNARMYEPTRALISDFFPEILSKDSISLDHDDSTTSERFSDTGHFESHEVSNNHEELDSNNDPRKILSDIRRKNLNININFLEGRFDALKLLVEDKLDVLVVTETNIDASYPTSQFTIKGKIATNMEAGFLFTYESI